MNQEQTLCIIKPDAVKKQLIGNILHHLEQQFTIVGLKMTHLSKQEAIEFYKVHEGKPFFEGLTSFLSSGPIVVAVLQGDNVIQRYRNLMGATNPTQAAAGTLRALYATSIDHNAVHGSDAADTAKVEINFFFKKHELVQAD